LIDQCPSSQIESLSTTSPGRKAVALGVKQEADAIERDATITKPVYEALAEAEPPGLHLQAAASFVARPLDAADR
jgi:hypothetical protein